MEHDVSSRYIWLQHRRARARARAVMLAAFGRLGVCSNLRAPSVALAAFGRPPDAEPAAQHGSGRDAQPAAQPGCGRERDAQLGNAPVDEAPVDEDESWGDWGPNGKAAPMAKPAPKAKPRPRPPPGPPPAHLQRRERSRSPSPRRPRTPPRPGPRQPRGPPPEHLLAHAATARAHVAAVAAQPAAETLVCVTREERVMRVKLAARQAMVRRVQGLGWGRGMRMPVAEEVEREPPTRQASARPALAPSPGPAPTPAPPPRGAPAAPLTPLADDVVVVSDDDDDDDDDDADAAEQRRRRSRTRRPCSRAATSAAAAPQNNGGMLEWSDADIAQLREDVSEKIKTLGKWKDDAHTQWKLERVVVVVVAAAVVAVVAVVDRSYIRFFVVFRSSEVIDKIAKHVGARPPASASDGVQAVRRFVCGVLGARGQQLCEWLVEHLVTVAPQGDRPLTVQLLSFGLENCDGYLRNRCRNGAGGGKETFSDRELTDALARLGYKVDVVYDARQLPDPGASYLKKHTGHNYNIIARLVQHRNFRNSSRFAYTCATRRTRACVNFRPYRTTGPSNNS